MSKNNLEFFIKLFDDKHIIFQGSFAYIDTKLDECDFQNFLCEFESYIYQIIPHLELKINFYSIYEEEYGGSCHYGVLGINIDNLSKKDMRYIKEEIYALFI